MIRFIILGISLILAQVVIFKNVAVFGSGFCFPYILFLLLLPVATNRIALIFAGFFIGIFVDMFYDTAGINAAACVAIMFLRPFWLSSLLSGSNMDTKSRININAMGLSWFLIYVTPIVLIHIAIILFVEASDLSLFWVTLYKVLFSTLLTVISMTLLQFLFSAPKARSI
jgi:hypothetical protein